MLKIESLSDIRGNNIVIYAIKTLLDRGTFPKFTLMSGNMGVGKSTVARLVAEQINANEFPVITYNFGLQVDMHNVEDEVFKLNPSKPRAFVFEELHGLSMQLFPLFMRPLIG